MSALKQISELASGQPQHRAVASEIGDKVAVSRSNTLAPRLQNQTHQPTAVIQRKPGEDEELSVQRMLIGGQNSTLQAFRPAHTNNTYSSPGKLPFIQKKLTVNTPGDQYEQEADAMADKVMRMKDPFLPPSSDTFFKKQTVAPIQRKCAACGEEDKLVHRKENSASEVQGSDELDSYVGSLGSSGSAMPESSRQFFEPRFGQDFSNVRIHNDSVAAKSAQSINALAYTTGNNIVFNHGQYSPGSEPGQRLMAHELTHVVQQTHGFSLMKNTNEPMMQKSIGNNSFLSNNQSHSARVSRFLSNTSMIQRDDQTIPVDLVPVSPEENKRLKEMNVNLPTVSPETFRSIGGIADNAGKKLSEAEKTKIEQILKSGNLPAALPIASVNGPKFLLHDTSSLLGAAKLKEEADKGRGPMGAGVSAWIPKDTPAVIARPNFYESKRPSTTEYEKGTDIIKQSDREAALVEVWKFANTTTKNISIDKALANQGLKQEEITAIKSGARAFLEGGTTKVDGAKTTAAWAVGEVCAFGQANGFTAAAEPGKEKNLEDACAKLKRYFQERPGRSESFVTVEIIQAGAIKADGNQNTCNPKNPNIAPMPNPAYTDNQYNNIAMLYLRAALTAGSFPEITTHFVIDAFERGHCDPRCFNLDNLYKQIALILGHGVGSTYGVNPKYGLTWGTDTIWWDSKICGKSTPS